MGAGLRQIDFTHFLSDPGGQSDWDFIQSFVPSLQEKHSCPPLLPFALIVDTVALASWPGFLLHVLFPL